jgi:CubicO group peptidase (beta-lactamase class C family)
MRLARITTPPFVALLLVTIGDAARIAAIPPLIKFFVDSGEIPGAVVLIAQHGTTVLSHASGFRDVEARSPMTIATIFQVKSMTKPITGTGIMMLREQGRLSFRTWYLNTSPSSKISDLDPALNPLGQSPSSI